MSRESFIAWHGSPQTFDRFDFSKLRDALGVFFTESREAAENYGTTRQYRLTFRNILRVHQGREYVDWLWKRDGEKTERDVRRRLMRDGYDGVRIEYCGGAIDYVAFSNRNISPMLEGEQYDGGNVVQCAKAHRVRHDAVLVDRVRLKGE